MDDVIKTVTSATRAGGIANLTFETVEGESVSIKFDIRYLWAVAADLRAASIDLLAPVPEALKAAIADTETSEDDDKANDQNELGGVGQEEPKSGFPGLEQAWLLCDTLNQAHLEQPNAGPAEILKEIAAQHFLVDQSRVLIASEDGASIEVPLANEFKIIYRSDTNDWVPDRKETSSGDDSESS